MTERSTEHLAALLLAAAAAAAGGPLLAHPRRLPRDGMDHFHLAAVDRFIVLRFGQFPFRSPYHEGGYPTFAHPDDLSLSPRFALILGLGPWAGLKVEHLLNLFLGMWGTYALLRRQERFPPAAALVSATTFGLGGFFLFRWCQGWMVNTRSGVFPWLLYFWWRSRDDRRYYAALGLTMASLLVDAKYALAVFTWFAVLWMLLRLDRTEGGGAGDRLAWRRFAAWGALVVWAVLLAGVKVVPLVPLLRSHFALGGQGVAPSMAQTMLWLGLAGALGATPWAVRRAPRRRAILATSLVAAAALALLVALGPVYDMPWGHRLRAIWEALPRSLVSFPSAEAWMVASPDLRPESSPVGWVGLALALAGVVLRWQRVRRLAVLTVLLLWIDLGHAAPVDLQGSLRALPVLSVLRNPASHFNLYLLFCLAVLAGWGTRAIAEAATGRGARLVPWVLLLANLGYLGAHSWRLYEAMSGPPLEATGGWQDFHLVRSARAPERGGAIALLYRNVGVMDWRRSFRSAESAVEPAGEEFGGPRRREYRGEVYFLEPGSPNQVLSFSLTPLRIRVEVDVRQPGTLCINQVRDFQWFPSEGRPSRGSPTLGVDLTRTGRYEVRLRYVPVLFLCGLGVSVAALVAGLVVIRRLDRRSGRAPMDDRRTSPLEPHTEQGP